MSELIEENVTTPLLKNTTEDLETEVGHGVPTLEGDDEWGGFESRQHLERQLVWKVDKRMSILVLIYILNYVRCLYNSCIMT
jgi:hypothetical protein